MRGPYDARSAMQPGDPRTSADLPARAEDLNLTVRLEDANASERARRARQRWDAEIAEARAASERYLKEHEAACELIRAHLEAERTADTAG